MDEQPLVILHNTDEPRDVPEIPRPTHTLR